MKRIFLAITVLSVALSALIAPLTSAQANGGQALEIGPPVINLSADPGQVITTNISVRDVSTTSLIVTNEINDFIANGEDGTPKVVLDLTEESPYSIRSWITPIEPLLLKSKEIKSIPLTISVPADAAPGGYYGIVRFTGTPPDLEGTGVSLSASLGSLIFLRVNGAAKEEMSIEQFYANDGTAERPLFEFKPITLSVRLKNTGNIYEQPTGLVTVKNMFGKAIATLPVNAAQRTILPDSTRKFDQLVDNTVLGDGLMFGLYSADVTIKYGSSGQEEKATTSFWVIPYKLIIAAVILLIIAFIVFRFLLRRYNRAIVAKATGVAPPKKVKKPRKSKKK